MIERLVVEVVVTGQEVFLEFVVRAEVSSLTVVSSRIVSESD